MIIISKIKESGKIIIPNVVTTIKVDENSADQRVDNFLIKHLRRVPKSHIYQLVRSGQVRVNSKRVSASYRLVISDVVRIPPIRMERKHRSDHNVIAKSRFVSFDILYQDDCLLIIDKPAGLAVHGGSGVSFGVIEQLREQHPDWKFLELVHRLDRETSGVLLLAKKRKALVQLHSQIRQNEVEKRYLVMVKGRWRNLKQSVKLPLNKYITANGERRVAVMKTASGNKKEMSAHTIFTLQKLWERYSLLEAELKTGRTHQIRVHLAHLGFPIIGDDKYGDFKLNKQLARHVPELRLERMFLHAYKVVITHPISGVRLQIEAPLTNDLQTFVDGLNT